LRRGGGGGQHSRARRTATLTVVLVCTRFTGSLAPAMPTRFFQQRACRRRRRRCLSSPLFEERHASRLRRHGFFAVAIRNWFVNVAAFITLDAGTIARLMVLLNARHRKVLSSSAFPGAMAQLGQWHWVRPHRLKVGQNVQPEHQGELGSLVQRGSCGREERTGVAWRGRR